MNLNGNEIGKEVKRDLERSRTEIRIQQVESANGQGQEMMEPQMEKLKDLGPNFQLLFVIRHNPPFSIRDAAASLGLSVPGVKLGLRRLRINIYKQLHKLSRKV